MRHLKIYTDGGCHGNPGPGGWAFRIVTDNDEVLLSYGGFDPMTTNNRMELVAVIEGLQAVQQHTDPEAMVTVVTDSQYVRMGITDWIRRWERNGWLTAAKKPVKNVDLWQTLRGLEQRIKPQWTWVKGHSGDEHNEGCDRLVQEQIRSRGEA